MWALLEGGWWESTSGRRWHLSRALRDPHSSVSKESACNAGDPGSIPGLGRSPGGGIGYPLQCSWASLVAQLAKNSACNAGDLGLIPGLGRSPREGKGSPLQYYGLENSMGCIVRGVAKSRTGLSDSHLRDQWDVAGGGSLRERGEERHTQFVGTDGQTELTVARWRGWDDLGDQEERHFKCHSLCVQTTEAPGWPRYLSQFRASFFFSFLWFFKLILECFPFWCITLYILYVLIVSMGSPSGSSGKEPACNAGDVKRHRFNPWVGKIPLEEGMATHSSILAWRIPWTEEPGRL